MTTPGENWVTLDTRYVLGVARVNGGDPRAGVADLRAFIEASPQHPDVASARRTINETLARYGDRQELQDTYTALMTQSPTTAEALNDAASIAGRLARPKDQEAAREEQREWRSALVAYESVAARSPDPTLRDWAKERVAAVKQRLSDGSGAAK